MSRSEEFMEGVKHRWGATVAERSANLHAYARDKAIKSGQAKDSADYERQYAELRQESRDSD